MLTIRLTEVKLKADERNTSNACGLAESVTEKVLVAHEKGECVVGLRGWVHAYENSRVFAVL